MDEKFENPTHPNPIRTGHDGHNYLTKRTHRDFTTLHKICCDEDDVLVERRRQSRADRNHNGDDNRVPTGATIAGRLGS